MKLVLARIGTNPTVQYAFDELVRCFGQMDEKLFMDRRVYEKRVVSAEGILWVGLDGSVSYATDDEICIDIRKGAGIITGSNERSVLIAVYRVLYEMGCRFVRPGKDGELLQKQSIAKDTLNIQIHEKPSYRHRSVCIEGANDYQHIADMIEWLPKIGMNGYFVQFHTPNCFFNRWYAHEGNPLLDGEELGQDDVKHIWKSLEEEILKRGLMYHAVGHGWTCEPFGIEGGGWGKYQGELPAEKRQYLAQVDGVRELWNQVSLNTNLCYSNPEGRNIVTDSIVNYCKENPAVEYLHFWLADDSNNHCECENCRDTRPADFYVKMLNELDEKLTAANITTKIVFLVYVDLLWEPEFERLRNKDRFVLMFAPITRTYTNAFADDYRILPDEELSGYVRNKLVMPNSVAENVTRLSKWQKQFDGDSFDYDYHIMWDHVLDPGYYECARILHKDMANLEKIGLNGMVSCQIQRAFYPTGLPMYAMARGLWDKTSDFREIAQEYFAAAFGEAGNAVEDYMRTLSHLFHPPYLRHEMEQVNAGIAANFARIANVVDAFQAAYIAPNQNKNLSWKYLSYHAEYCKLLAETLHLRASGEAEAAKEKLEEWKQYIRRTEMQTHRVFDTWNALHVLDNWWRKQGIF